MSDVVFRGQYADATHAPLLSHLRCTCPLFCPQHGENGPIPGDMKTPAQPWEGLQVQLPGQAPAYLGGPQPQQAQQVPVIPMSPASVGSDGVVGAAPDPNAMQWQPVQAPIHQISVHQTPAAIVPVEVENAQEILNVEGISVGELGETVVLEQRESEDGPLAGRIVLNFDSANALAQEILKAKKRIELTLPETLETTLAALRQRAGHDMAPLIDLIAKALKNGQA